MTILQEPPAVVLPDTLVAQLIDNAATLSAHLRADFAQVAAVRDTLRATLIRERQVIAVDLAGSSSLTEYFTVDGAHLAEVDRASAYSASCAVRVGVAQEMNAQRSCLAILPHVPSLNTLSSSLMMMQEIMTAVEAVETNPDTICLIDGSRLSAIISINQFYQGVSRDLPGQLQQWRIQAQQEPTREPARTLALFESRDWLGTYLTHERIVGNLKLVTTTKLIEQYVPQWIGRFDDKTFAAVILEAGEALRPLPLPPPEEPYHIGRLHPHYRTVDRLGPTLSEVEHDNQIHHIYYRPDVPHGVFKIEVNKALLRQHAVIRSVLKWWSEETISPDVHEPYSFFIADRFAKEAVSVAKSALREITRRDIDSASWAWHFIQAYRTE